jgi:hypothetical protein
LLQQTGVIRLVVRHSLLGVSKLGLGLFRNFSVLLSITHKGTGRHMPLEWR